MKNREIRILGVFFLVSFLVFSGFFLANNREIFLLLAHLSAFNFLILIALSTLFVGINGILLRLLAIPFGINLRNSFWISAASSLINLLTFFRAGAGFRAWYLQKKYKLSYVDFAAGFLGLSILVILCASLTLLIFFIFWKRETFPLFLFLGVLSFFLLGISALFFNKTFVSSSHFVQKYNAVIEGWRKIVGNRKVFFLLCFFIMTSLLISALLLFYLFQSLEIQVSFQDSLFVSTFAFFSLFFTITPGGLGVAESFQVFSGNLLGIPLETILFVALIQRAIQTITLLFFGSIGKIILFRDLKK